jgi:hypothetical protein
MPLQHRTIQKLLREDFPGTNPLVVDPARREKIAADLKARLERLDGVDTKEHSWVREEEKPRFVCSFSILDNEAYYYYASRVSFHLLLDNTNRLILKETRCGSSALVGDLDEVVRFVRHCKQRLERQKALRSKRGKVRDLLAQAILAHVRKLAHEVRFDFMSETDAQKLNLFVKLSEEHALVLPIPFKEFKQFLPHLRLAIVTLRQLYQSGLRFQIVGRHGLPCRKTWITHDNLEKDDKTERDE